MKILNLYAGIGGNRKLWGDEHEITAVENVDYIASEYARLWPNDMLVIADAHQYLLENYIEFDFIWSSPPCPTHSRMNHSFMSENRRHLLKFPDMKLYEEIIFLREFYAGKWVVENVEPYYPALIQPTVMFDRHLYWSNFPISFRDSARMFNVARATETELAQHFGLDIKPSHNNRKLLRNAVDPEDGAHILKAAMREVKQESLL